MLNFSSTPFFRTSVADGKKKSDRRRVWHLMERERRPHNRRDPKPRRDPSSKEGSNTFHINNSNRYEIFFFRFKDYIYHQIKKKNVFFFKKLTFTSLWISSDLKRIDHEKRYKRTFIYKHTEINPFCLKIFSFF